jgi:S-adenosylmethionine decarboxylase
LEALGNHVLLELYGCDPKALNSVKNLKNVFVTAAGKSNATVLKTAFHQFNPHGVSGVVIISESHFTVHTWPEHEYAAVDIFCCGDKMDVEAGAQSIAERLRAKQISRVEVRRGILNS